MFPSNRPFSHDIRKVHTPADVACDSVLQFAIGCTMTSAIARVASGESTCRLDQHSYRAAPCSWYRQSGTDA